MRATRALIHMDNFSSNIKKIRSHIGPGPKILLPVKADAYGHGSERMAQAALDSGVSHLAVATAGEGEALRACGIDAPILLLSLAMPEEYPLIVGAGLEPLCADIESLRGLEACAEAAGRRLIVHIKVDTGMGRIGCSPEELPLLAQFVSRSRFLGLGGVSTHFPVSDSDDAADKKFTYGQIEAFFNLVSDLRRRGILPGLVSAANSGAVLSYPDSWFDLVRPGILCYGYYPAPVAARPFAVLPVMEFLSKVAFIKKIKAGQSLSYGRTWTATRDSLIATLPVGYADGYPRALSNKGQVEIRGQLYPLVGRVCMDQCMVDLGPESDVALYEDAVLFGPGAVGADGIAAACGSIAYEITCNINKRVPRHYVGL